MVDLEFLAEDGDIFVLRGEFVELESEFVDEDGEERLLGEDSHAVNISVLKVETEADAAKGVFLVHQIVVLEQDILAVVIGEVVDDALDQILALLAIKLKKYGCHRALHDHSLLNFAHLLFVGGAVVWNPHHPVPIQVQLDIVGDIVVAAAVELLEAQLRDYDFPALAPHKVEIPERRGVLLEPVCALKLVISDLNMVSFDAVKLAHLHPRNQDYVCIVD